MNQHATLPLQLGRVCLSEGDVLDYLRTIRPSSCSLVVSSPPYNIRKPYERSDNRTYKEYIDWQRHVLEVLTVSLTDNASVCWQVGTYVADGEIFPLDIPFVQMFRDLGFQLRNRIIWRYNFGHNADKRFSGRYETLLWFSRTNKYTFNLDPVRIPQMYPGKRHSKKKGEKGGAPSGNPLGKNPSDYWEFSATEAFQNNPVWDIPNVKANHPEYTVHPCQFPVELAERCILALSNIGDTVLDPFIGTGATAIAAAKHGRHAIGGDRFPEYIEIAKKRLSELKLGTISLRPLGRPVRRPISTERVSQIPEEWRGISSEHDGDQFAES